MEIRMLTAGEQGLVIEFGSVIDAAVNQRVHCAARAINAELSELLTEVVPTYRSLAVYFDPLLIRRSELIERIEALLQALPESEEQGAARIVKIPVCYGGEFGPDLEFVAAHNGLAAEEVISIHASTPYLVYMLGFTPGFPYLGGMSERIATPRLATPRTKIPAGSVGIAGNQTGFYPIESPGGWQLIGRTPLKAFRPEAAQPFLFAAGDYLQFSPVSALEYAQIEQEVQRGAYVLQWTMKGGAAE